MKILRLIMFLGWAIPVAHFLGASAWLSVCIPCAVAFVATFDDGDSDE